MARVTTVPKARKEWTCSRCQETIQVGDPYRHATPGFRGRKIVRCTKPECRFRQSDLTTSHMRSVWEAIEAAEDSLSATDWATEYEPENAGTLNDDLQAIVDEARDGGVQEALDAYQEALDAWENGNEQIQEYLDLVEEFHNELDGLDLPEWDANDEAPEDADEADEDDEDEADTRWEDHVQECVDAVETALAAFSG